MSTTSALVHETFENMEVEIWYKWKNVKSTFQCIAFQNSRTHVKNIPADVVEILKVRLIILGHNALKG